MGARWIVQALKQGRDAGAIAQEWQGALDAFRARRVKYLLY
jgi:hypothetical protein